MNKESTIFFKDFCLFGAHTLYLKNVALFTIAIIPLIPNGFGYCQGNL